MGARPLLYTYSYTCAGTHSLSTAGECYGCVEIMYFTLVSHTHDTTRVVGRPGASFQKYGIFGSGRRPSIEAANQFRSFSETHPLSPRELMAICISLGLTSDLCRSGEPLVSIAPMTLHACRVRHTGSQGSNGVRGHHMMLESRRHAWHHRPGETHESFYLNISSEQSLQSLFLSMFSGTFCETV